MTKPKPHREPQAPAAQAAAAPLSRVGERIRRLRLGRSMGLVELGRHTGLSASLLSKLETGRNLPTLPTLQRIAMVFSVGLEHFFRDDEGNALKAVVRRADRLRFPDRQGAKAPSYHFESLDFPAVDRRLSAYFAEFEPVKEAGAVTHEHPGVELVYVIEGQLGLWHDGEETVLGEGDSVYLESGRPHGYRRLGAKPCRALVVTVP